MFAAIGAVAGFFAGLLGVGGGAVITPMLVIVLAHDFPAAAVTHMAVASSLAVIVLTSIPSMLTHARHAAVDWRTGGVVAAGACGGALLVSGLAHRISGSNINVLLALFLLGVSLDMLWPQLTSGARKIFRRHSAPRWLPVIGALIGAVSALFGIGGGVMSVPFLAGRGMPVKRAIGTSAFIGGPMALFATAGYIVSGLHNDSLPAGTLGYVYLPAVGGIALFSVIFAVLGANLTAKLPDRLLRGVFGLMVAVLAVRLLARVAG